MANKTSLNPDEFKKFFDDATATANGARGPNVTLMQVLQQHGLEPNLPDTAAAQLHPMLNQPIGQMRDIPHNCNWCGTCSLCGACGELNAAAIGAASAAAVHVLD